MQGTDGCWKVEQDYLSFVISISSRKAPLDPRSPEDRGLGPGDDQSQESQDDPVSQPLPSHDPLRPGSTQDLLIPLWPNFVNGRVRLLERPKN